MEDNSQGLSDEKLLRNFNKGVDLALKAAEEVFRRGGISCQHLCCILKIEEIRFKEEIIKRAKRKAEELIIEKFLDEDGFFTILREGSEEAKKTAAKKYRADNKSIPNSILTEIIERVRWYRSWAINRLLEQNPTEDERLLASRYAKLPILNKILEEEFQRGMSLKRAAEYIEDSPKAAKIVWNKLCEERRQYDFSDEQAEDIVRYGEYLPARIELGQKLLAKLIQRLKFLRQKLMLNPNSHEIEVDIFELERTISEIEKNIPKKKTTCPSSQKPKKAGTKFPAIFLKN